MNLLRFLPSGPANFADRFDALFFTLLALTFLFGGGVIFFAVYWSVKYRAGSASPRKRPEHEYKALESLLIGGPLILGLCIFLWGFRDYSLQRTIPPDAIEVFVMGKQWMWHIQHTNGAREMNNLTVPLNRPVRLTMISQDVIHAFYIPEFRIQYQVIPGRYSSEWFVPTRLGSFVFVCNQYCGMDHSRMYGHVNVVSQSDYDRWLQQQERPGFPSNKSLFEAGRDLFQSDACVNCHAAHDTPLGPSLLGFYGRNVALTDGSTVTADDDYVRRTIVNPGREIVSGYTNSMPTYNELNEQQLWSLLVYLRGLKTPAQLPKDEPVAPALKGSS